MMSKIDPGLKSALDSAAATVAPAFAVDVSDVALLALSENAVYRVDTSGGERFVVRLHRPGYNTIDEMHSEHTWVQSLAAAGVPVSHPRSSLAGDPYVEVAVGDHKRWAGAVEWVAGEPMGDVVEADPDVVETAYRSVGEIAAKIANHSETWQAPDGFTRRHWNAEGLVGTDPIWGRFWEVPELPAAKRDLFAKARAQLFDELSALPTDPASYGLIHADLHLRNEMFDGDACLAIDFDDAGFGWYAHELAVAVSPAIEEPWEDAARRSLFEGYRSVRPLSAEGERLVEVFVVVRSLMTIGWLAARPELGLVAELPNLGDEALEVVEPYLDGTT